jgi:uncharacterized protein (DUF3084 family)
MRKPPYCPNCMMLRSIIEDLHRQLMAFHRAGQVLADNEVALLQAKADAEIAKARKAEADAQRSVAIAEGGPSSMAAQEPVHGSTGHTRQVIRKPDLKTWLNERETEHAHT